MRKILEDYFLARTGWLEALTEIIASRKYVTAEQGLGVCEVLKKLKTAEINVDEAESRLNELFDI